MTTKIVSSSITPPVKSITAVQDMNDGRADAHELSHHNDPGHVEHRIIQVATVIKDTATVTAEDVNIKKLPKQNKLLMEFLGEVINYRSTLSGIKNSVHLMPAKKALRDFGDNLSYMQSVLWDFENTIRSCPTEFTPGQANACMEIIHNYSSQIRSLKSEIDYNSTRVLEPLQPSKVISDPHDMPTILEKTNQRKESTTHGVKTSKIPLITNLKEEFGFANLKAPLNTKIVELSQKRVITPPKQLLSYAIMERNMQQVMNAKTDLTALGYKPHVLRLSKTETIEAYTSPFPMISHKTGSMDRILGSLPPKGTVSKNKNFILNSCEKISTSIIHEDLPAYGEKNEGFSIILKVKPSAIAETSPIDANTPLMSMTALEKNYLLLRNKSNSLLGYLNEIIHIAYLNLNKEHSTLQTQDLTHVMDMNRLERREGIIQKLIKLKSQYKEMDEMRRIKEAQDIFGVEVNQPIDEILQGLIDECEQIGQSLEPSTKDLSKQTEWDLVVDAQKTSFEMVGHFPLGPIELRSHLTSHMDDAHDGLVGFYTELAIASTRHQEEGETPNIEIAAVGLSRHNISKNGLEFNITSSQGESEPVQKKLKEAHSKGLPILLI